MPQLRLTSKMANELKVTELQTPANNQGKLYDDWYVDVTRILRKKVFVFMHIRTRVGLAMPSYEIGGVQNLLECFPLLLREFSNQLNYETIAVEAYGFFTVPLAEIRFVKTNNKSILRYVSDFKQMLELDAGKVNNITQVVCDSTSEHWLNRLIQDSVNPKDYTTPLELINALYGTNKL